MKTKYFTFFFLLFISLYTFGQTFTEQTVVNLPYVSRSSVAWGDFDNDGYLDVFLTGCLLNGNSKAAIYRNNGDGSFTEQTNFMGLYGSVALGDYSNDGYLDVLISGNPCPIANCYTLIYNLGLQDTMTQLIGVGYGPSIIWGDYNNDGLLDILSSGINSDYPFKTRIYKNNGDNNFTEQTEINLPGVQDGSVSFADYNNDGFLDILITGQSNSDYISKIYKNNGNSTFTEQTGLNITSVTRGSVAWGDYNNDGFLDILLTGFDNINNNGSTVNLMGKGLSHHEKTV